MSGTPHRIAPLAVLTLLVFLLGLVAFAGLFTRAL
jgi:hypothetical protein